MKNKNFFILIGILVLFLSIILVSAAVIHLNTSHFKLKSASAEWADFYGSLTINKKPAAVGSEVAVFDSNGNLCGVFVVREKGKYGFLHVYGDDSSTKTIDEGAVAGEKITFKIYDSKTRKEKIAAVSAVWDSFGKTQVDLAC